MLFIVFQLGQDRYALEARQVRRVLPLVQLKAIPGAPPGVAGLLDYHGQPAPVLDLGEYAGGAPAAQLASTRILLVDYAPGGGAPRLLGLRVERAVQTLRCPPADFVEGGLSLAGAPYLGPVRPDASGLVQWVRIEQLLPDRLRDMLYQSGMAASQPPT